MPKLDFLGSNCLTSATQGHIGFVYTRWILLVVWPLNQKWWQWVLQTCTWYHYAHVVGTYWHAHAPWPVHTPVNLIWHRYRVCACCPCGKIQIQWAAFEPSKAKTKSVNWLKAQTGIKHKYLHKVDRYTANKCLAFLQGGYMILSDGLMVGNIGQQGKVPTHMS